MKVIADKILEPNDTDNKKPVIKKASCGFSAIGNWADDRHNVGGAYGRGGYSYNPTTTPTSEFYRPGDRVRVKNTTSQMIVFGKVMGTVSGKKELYVHVDGMDRNVFASTDIANRTNDFIVISKA
jgi:hypothetical protein